MEAIFLKLDFEKAFDSVSWDFFFENWRQTGLGNSGLDGSKLVCSPGHHPFLLMGSRVITFNVVGVLDKEILSPYVFILVASTLTRILFLAGENGSIKKVGFIP